MIAFIDVANREKVKFGYHITVAGYGISERKLGDDFIVRLMTIGIIPREISNHTITLEMHNLNFKSGGYYMFKHAM